jgi:transcription elongation factor Elf1
MEGIAKVCPYCGRTYTECSAVSQNAPYAAICQKCGKDETEQIVLWNHAVLQKRAA